MAIPEKDAPGIARGRMNSLFLFPSPGLSQNAILEVSHVVLGFYKKKVSISLTLRQQEWFHSPCNEDPAESFPMLYAQRGQIRML